jgi:hypothetical protein
VIVGAVVVVVAVIVVITVADVAVVVVWCKQAPNRICLSSSVVTKPCRHVLLSLSHPHLDKGPSTASPGQSREQSITRHASVEGDTVGTTVGIAEGILEGLPVGDLVGDSAGLTEGISDGVLVGTLVGDRVGLIEGIPDGEFVGTRIGDSVGLANGTVNGVSVGFTVGDPVGANVNTHAVEITTEMSTTTSDRSTNLEISDSTLLCCTHERLSRSMYSLAVDTSLASSPLPLSCVSRLSRRPSPPSVTPATYNWFAARCTEISVRKEENLFTKSDNAIPETASKELMENVTAVPVVKSILG